MTQYVPVLADQTLREQSADPLSITWSSSRTVIEAPKIMKIPIKNPLFTFFYENENCYLQEPMCNVYMIVFLLQCGTSSWIIDRAMDRGTIYNKSIVHIYIQWNVRLWFSRRLLNLQSRSMITLVFFSYSGSQFFVPKLFFRSRSIFFNFILTKIFS